MKEYLIRHTKITITVVLMFIILINITPESMFDTWLFRFIGGVICPIVYGLLWGQHHWDEQPYITLAATLLCIAYVALVSGAGFVAYITPFVMGLLLSQLALFYLGRADEKKA